MDVHGLSQNAAGHCRALNVPPWAALSQTEVSEKNLHSPTKNGVEAGEGGGGGISTEGTEGVEGGGGSHKFGIMLPHENDVITINH